MNLKLLSSNTSNVIIYGAGEAGAQLEAALKLAGNKKVISHISSFSKETRFLARSQGIGYSGTEIRTLIKLQYFKAGINTVLPASILLSAISSTAGMLPFIFYSSLLIQY